MPPAIDISYSLHSTQGAGQIPLVLIHGAGGNHLYWPPQIRRLSGSRIYALDLPGHGRNLGAGRQSISAYMEAVATWMDQIGTDRAVFAGHSMGSAITLSLALEHPQRVQGLILLGAGARLRVHPDILTGIADQANFHNTIQMIVEWNFAPQAPPRLVDLARQRMADTQPAVLLGDLMACDGFDVISRLGEIDCPTLVICGEEDRMTPMRYAQYLADHIKGARIEIIQGAGHMVMLEKPQEVRNHMLEFLRTISDGASSQAEL